jgi:hypothetical protein
MITLALLLFYGVCTCSNGSLLYTEDGSIVLVSKSGTTLPGYKTAVTRKAISDFTALKTSNVLTPVHCVVTMVCLTAEAEIIRARFKCPQCYALLNRMM